MSIVDQSLAKHVHFDSHYSHVPYVGPLPISAETVPVLGPSDLGYLSPDLQAIYREKALQAEWRLDTFGPATRPGREWDLQNLHRDDRKLMTQKWGG